MVAFSIVWTSSLSFDSLFCDGLGAFRLSLDSGVAVEGQEKFSMIPRFVPRFMLLRSGMVHDVGSRETQKFCEEKKFRVLAKK